MTSVFGIKVQINKKVIRLVLPPSLSASLSLIHNASASLVLMLALALVLVYVLLKKNANEANEARQTDRQIDRQTDRHNTGIS